MVKEVIAIFASGSGSNAEVIMDHFENHSSICIGLVVTSRQTAGVIERAKNHAVPILFTSSEDLESGKTERTLNSAGITMIVLAGFLLKIPDSLISAYPDRIINIHPSLLPKYGGKGMYGGRVHRAVIDNGETESGITIHLVNEHYDEGRIIAQHKCAVLDSDTPEKLQKRVHELEHSYYAPALENYLRQL